MKKLITLAAAAVTFAGAVVIAGPIENPDTCTEAEFRAAVAEALAPTNATTHSVYTHLQTNGLFSNRLRARFPEAFAELDATMAERGFLPAWFWLYPADWPKVSSRLAKENGADVAYSASYAICVRLGCELSPDSVVAAGGTLDDCITLLSEVVAFPPNCALSWQLTSFRSTIQKAALPVVRRYLRSQGKSFVTKNGVNPCEEYMTGLTTALNAPRFAGLDAWLKSVGLKGVDLSKLPSEEEVAKLKDAVFYGDRMMDNRATGILGVCLGVEGYNKFVKEYNGD